MENKYAVVEVCSEGVNPQVYIFENKEKAREGLKKLWKNTNDEMRKKYGHPILPYTWCDKDGDCGKITIEEENDWIFYKVVDVKEGYDG